MPRPNPPRKRPRRRPDAVERNTRAEVSLTKQTAQVKERNGGADAKQPTNAKALPSTKTRTNTKAGPQPRVRPADIPYEPWAPRSYAIFVAVIAVAEVVVGSGLFLTLSNIKINFGLFLLALDEFNPLIAVLGAILAAPIAKFISKETRTLRFVESAMAGVTQYFIWLVLSFAVTFLIGGFNVTTAPATGTGSSSTSSTPLPTVAATPTPGSSSTGASPTPKASATTVVGITTVTATPGFVAALILVDLISFVATFYIYPPLYRRLRRRPMPPRQPRAPRPKRGEKTEANDAPTSDAKPKRRGKTNVEKMDDAAARQAEADASDDHAPAADASGSEDSANQDSAADASMTDEPASESEASDPTP